MQIDEITCFEPRLLAQLNALLPQLSRSAPPLLETELRATIESDATHLLAAREDERVAWSCFASRAACALG